VISEYINLKKIVGGGEGKRSILQDSEVKLETFVNSVLFCFTKDLVSRNTIHWWTTRFSICSF